MCVLPGSEEGDLQVEVVIEHSSWRRRKESDVWLVRRPLSGGGWEHEGDVWARIGERVVPVPQQLRLIDFDRAEPGTFLIGWEELYYRELSGEGPPEEVVLVTRVDRGHEQAGAWRVALGGCSGEGFLVWSGHTERVAVDLAEESTLRFFLSTESTNATSEAAYELLVRANGDTVLRAQGRAPDASWHSVAIEGRGPVELELEITGDAIGALLSPVLGPRDVASEPSRRPDLVLFLADTLRADALALYGGSPEITPHLNRFAEKSTSYLRAYAPSSWTLPSQATMLSGLQPHQHGSVKQNIALSDELTLLAEHFAAWGYRTGAITDSGYISRSWGFDRGFAWFEERAPRHHDLTYTLEAARKFLEASDGRPSLLFVQTFRTHVPYRVGVEEDRELYAATARAHGPAFLACETREDRMEARRRLGADLFGIYMQGAHALDEELGAWIDELESAGWFEHNFFLFTSDHGELLGDHGRLGHGGMPWEQLSRVPLLLRGPGLASAEVERAATLQDLPRTFAALADVPPAEGWGGRALTTIDADRPVLGFVGKPNEVVVVEGLRKLIADPALMQEGGYQSAFELDPLPSEETALPSAEAVWAEAMSRRNHALVLEAMRPQVRAEEIDLAEGDKERLRELGYTGD